MPARQIRYSGRIIRKPRQPDMPRSKKIALAAVVDTCYRLPITAASPVSEWPSMRSKRCTEFTPPLQHRALRQAETRTTESHVGPGVRAGIA